VRDGLSKEFSRTEGGVRHAQAQPLSEEVQWMQVILEDLCTRAIGIPGTCVGAASLCCTEEPF
jgi:hypothetical protein